MPERARDWPRQRRITIDYGLLASRLMLAVAVVLLAVQRAPGVAWPLLVCGLALLSIRVATR